MYDVCLGPSVCVHTCVHIETESKQASVATCQQLAVLSEGVNLGLFLFFQLFCKVESFPKNDFWEKYV